MSFKDYINLNLFDNDLDDSLNIGFNPKKSDLEEEVADIILSGLKRVLIGSLAVFLLGSGFCYKNHSKELSSNSRNYYSKDNINNYFLIKKNYSSFFNNYRLNYELNIDILNKK